MTKLCDLLGARAEVMYECMYTKHKTQKRKVWQDGFVMLHASKRLVVYTDDEGKPGKAIDEVKLTPLDWDWKDEEYIEMSKFLVEIINGTPLSSIPSTQVDVPNVGSTIQTANTARRATNHRPIVAAGRGVRPMSNSKFCKPISRGPLRQARSGATGQVGNVVFPTTRKMKVSSSSHFDFDPERNPTSEWIYVPNAINRTPDEVLALLEIDN